MKSTTRFDQTPVVPGKPQGADQVPAGTFHGGDAIPAGTFH